VAIAADLGAVLVTLIVRGGVSGYGLLHELAGLSLVVFLTTLIFTKPDQRELGTSGYAVRAAVALVLLVGSMFLWARTRG
jgi:hypothetical protein